MGAVSQGDVWDEGVLGWLALDAVSQGDVWVVGSVDGWPWTQ